ncbi:MAG: ABC transporter permease subunit [Verrucomicrobium sp.]|nr:ABC transporter permease subunit [Verrucomicrobium sp.]
MAIDPHAHEKEGQEPAPPGFLGVFNPFGSFTTAASTLSSFNPRFALGAAVSLFRGSIWINLLVLLGVGALLFGTIDVAHEWRAPLRAKVDMDLSFWRLPQYTLYTLSRGLVAYAFSLLFTFIYARWAAYDAKAEKILIPALDILQSIPVLGFLPGLVLALVGLFPHSNFGLELACVLMFFTGQVWNMTFSFYYSLKSVPQDFVAVARLTGLSTRQFLWGVELPLAANGLVFNSMMSMAGGWFFLTITEAFTLGNKDFRLPGLGSYMSVAQQEGNGWAQIGAIVAMMLMIVVLDQLLFRPLVVWTQRFKLEDVQNGPADHSWFLDILVRSTLIRDFIEFLQRPRIKELQSRLGLDSAAPVVGVEAPPSRSSRFFYRLFLAVLGGLALYGAWKICRLVLMLHWREWLTILGGTGLTAARVFSALALGTLWTVPVGVYIGMRPRLQRIFQPIIQVAASFPSPMVFNTILTLLFLIHGSLSWGAVILMLMGTQWYIFFNVISGAAAIPADLHACGRVLGLKGWARWKNFYLPAIFPALVTGWITAAGGAWNASIVSEYVNSGAHTTLGLGSIISEATDRGDYPVLAASVILMALVVVGLNRFLWKPLQQMAESRCRILN